MKYISALVAAVIGLISLPSVAELSGTWEQEWAISTHKGDDSHLKSQKFESLIEPEWKQSFNDVELTALFRIRLDSEANLGPFAQKPNNYSTINGPWLNGHHGQLGLRELYLDGELSQFPLLPDTEWRLGKQQVVWGQADGLKVLDVVNPQSYREFILDEFDDSRIPLWMANLIVPIGDESSLQLLWIPDTTYHELPEAGTTYQLVSPLLVPKPTAGMQVTVLDANKPNRVVQDSDAGLRYSIFWDGWDITLNYLYHYQDLPVLYQTSSVTAVTIRPEYQRNHLIGGSISNAFGDFTLRAEIGYNTDTFQVSGNQNKQGVSQHEEVASVIGLDWQGLSDTFISVQWFQSHLINYDAQTVRDQTEHTGSFLFERNFSNETWKAELLALHSFNHEDGLIRPKISYMLLSNVEVWGGVDVFYGSSLGLYGQFDQNDRVLLGFQVGF